MQTASHKQSALLQDSPDSTATELKINYMHLTKCFGVQVVVCPTPRRPRSLVQRLTTWESVHTWGDPPIFPIASDEFPKLKSKHNLSFYCCSHFESVWGMNWSPFHSAYFRHGFCLVSSGCRSLANAADVAGVCLVWHKQLQGQLQHCRPVSWHDVSKAALTGR